MINSIDFKAEQVKLVLTGLISQTILHYDDSTRDLAKGMVLSVSFEGEIFKNYNLRVTGVKRTYIDRLTNKDVFLNGFLYKPHLVKFLHEMGFRADDRILRVDFELIKNNE